MAIVLAQIKDNDNQLKPCYVIHVNEVCSPELSSAAKYAEVSAAFEDLLESFWKVENISDDHVIGWHLLDTTKSKSKDGFYTEYHNGYLTIALNPNLQDYFIKIAHYTTWELENYMKLRSWYSMRLFEILSAFKDTGKWRVPIPELKAMLDLQGKYKRTTDFIVRVIEPVQQELEKTSLAFTFEAMGDDRLINRGRKQILWVEFQLKNIQPTTIPAHWYEMSEANKQILEILQHEFFVKESHIIRYLPFFDDGKELTTLINTWRRNKKTMQDVAKYCNSVWCKIGRGKKAAADKKNSI